jgi:hypothetical protein
VHSLQLQLPAAACAAPVNSYHPASSSTDNPPLALLCPQEGGAPGTPGMPGSGMEKMEGQQAPAAAPASRMPQLLPNAELLEKYMLWQNMYDNAIAEDPHKAMMDGGKAAQLVSELVDSVAKNTSPEEMGIFFAKRIWKHLYDVVGKQPLGPYLVPLELLTNMGCKRIPAEISQAFAAWDEARKFNIEVVEALIKQRLLALPELDAHVAKVLQATRSSQALDFALGLARLCKEGTISYTDMYNTLETALAITSRMPGVENAVQLIEQAKHAARMRVAERPMADGGAKDKTPDPPGLREQVGCAASCCWALLLGPAGGCL